MRWWSTARSRDLLCISIRLKSPFERHSKYNAIHTKSYNFPAGRFINTIHILYTIHTYSCHIVFFEYNTE